MELVPEFTYIETIEGPWGPTTGSPVGERLIWRVAQARLKGRRLDATLASPGSDWLRLGSDGIRRQDLRAAFIDGDGEVILFSYDLGVVRGGRKFFEALEQGTETSFDDQYMRIVPRFEANADRYGWLMDNVFVGKGRLAGPHMIEYDILRVT